MKKIVILGVIFLIVLSVIGCSTAGEKKHFKGLKIETWTDGYKFSFKTDDSESEWTTEKVLPKELSQEEKFAVRAWKDILDVKVSKEDGYLEKIWKKILNVFHISTREDKYLERIKVKEGIRLSIEALFTRIKTGKMDHQDVSMGFEDIEKALSIFWEVSFIAADRFVGNNDGYCSLPEIYKLNMSPQARIVSEMY